MILDGTAISKFNDEGHFLTARDVHSNGAWSVAGSQLLIATLLCLAIY